MRYLLGFLCVCGLGVLPLVGCSEIGPECRTAQDCRQEKCHVSTCSAAGWCQYDYSPSVACDDGNDCTSESCTRDWTCEYAEIHDVSCDFNGHAGICIWGVCNKDPCEDIVCDDGNDCTYDACDSLDGSCIFNRERDCAPCDWNGVPGACIERACEEDLCAGVVCDDDNLCTDDSCSCYDGSCRFSEGFFRCTDYDMCTEDLCDPDTGCQNPVAADGTYCGCLETRIVCGFPYCFPPVSECVRFGHCQDGECGPD